MKLRKALYFLVLATVISCSNDNSNLGDTYFSQQEYEKAVEAYSQYLKVRPRHVKTIYNRGRGYEELGKYDLAVADFNAVVKLDPQNSSAYLSLSQESYRVGDYKSVISFCDLVIEMENSNFMAYYYKARSLHKQNIFREALNNYNKAIIINPDMGEAFLHRGALYLTMKKKSEACSDLTRAVALNVEGAKEALTRNCK